MTKENIDLLLEKLAHGSFAHELVNLLKETERENWPWALDELLKARLKNKVQELENAKNQKP